MKESDWKLFRDLKDVLLERYCQLVLVAAEQVVQNHKKTNHERYLDLFSLIEKDNKALALAFDGISRSNALSRITFMRSGGLFTEEAAHRLSTHGRNKLKEAQPRVARTLAAGLKSASRACLIQMDVWRLHLS